MAPPDVDDRTQPAEAEGGGSFRAGFTPGRVAAIIFAVLMVLFWLWVFSGAPAKDNPDRLQDEAYVEDLEAKCQDLRKDLKTLPNAVEIEDAGERADVLDDANEMVGAFIEDVDASIPTDDADAKTSLEGWLVDWRTYLRNREEYADALRKDPEAQLLLDVSKLGDSVDKAIEIFAQVNGIPDCATPGDVG